MHPDIIDALRLALAHHPAFANRRRGYAMGGSPMAAGYDPTSYYTPRITDGANPFPAGMAGMPNQPNQPMPPKSTAQTGQSYTWAPLYPSAGSGVNIPHPPPPVGPSGLLGYAGSQPTLGNAPAYDWPLPYQAMGGGQWGGGQWGNGLNSGTGLKTGPSTNGHM